MAGKKNKKKKRFLRAGDLEIDLTGSENIIEGADDPSRRYLSGGNPLAGSLSERASKGTDFSSGSVRHGRPVD